MAIGSNAELLLAKLEDPELRKSTAEIIDTSFRAGELVAQLLRFARREPLELRTVELGSVVRGLEALLSRLLGKHLRFEVRLAAEPMFVRATEVMIQQVLTNLVVNASDAIAELSSHRSAVELSSHRSAVELSSHRSAVDGGTIVVERDTVAACESRTTAQPHARLRVIDDGAGMSLEVLSKLFEPFFTTKQPGEGTGLGLATVYSIVQCCGGVIDVESELGRGTTVTVLLPLVQAS